MARNGLLCVFIACGLVVMSGCGDDGGAGEKGPASATGDPSSVVKGEDPAPEGRVVELADENGFRYRTPLPVLGLKPQRFDEAAPPGRMFLHVDLTLKNLQDDRTARPTELVDDLDVAGPPEAGGGDDICRDVSGEGCGTPWMTCEHRDRKDSEGLPEELDDVMEPMPAGGTYRLRCFLYEPVPQSVDVRKLHLIQRHFGKNSGGFPAETYTEIPLT